MGDRYNGDDYRSPRTGGGYERGSVNKTIYVGNLRYDTEEPTVREWFEKYYGPVSHVKLIVDKETGRSKGFAFVTFDDEADATEALNDSNGRDLDGGIIRVNHARGPPSFAGGRRSFDGPSRGRGGYYSGRGRYGDSYHQGGRGGSGYRGGGSYHSSERDRSGERGGRDDERGHSEEERGRYSPRRSRSRSPPARGGKHEREYREEEYYAEEGGGGGKGGEGAPPKRRRRTSPSRSPSPSKSRSTGAASPSRSSGATSDSSGSQRRQHHHHHERAAAVEKRAAPGTGGSTKPPPSGEAVKMELMRLRKAEAELGGRVRALESEVKAGKAARLALEAQLEEAQAAGRSKDDSLRKYRQWLGALLECSTKLAAGRAAVAAAEAEVRQREGDLAVLNEEVAAFMSRAREEQLSSRRARRAAAAAAAGERSAGAEGDGQGGSLDRDSQYFEGEEGDAGLLGGSAGALAGPGGEGDAYAAGGGGGGGAGNGELRAVGGVAGGGGGGAAGERASEEAQLAEAMQYAMEEEMPPAGDGMGGGARDDAPAKFAPGVKFRLAM